jgi:predicted PurR-regulated permease PerM
MNEAPSQRDAPPAANVESTRANEADPGATPVAVVDVSRTPHFVLTGLFVLAIFYTLYLARSFLLPVALALLLAVVLSPAVAALKNLRIPEWLGSIVVVGALVSAVAYGAALLVGPANRWLEEAPETLREVEKKIRGVKRSVEEMRKATEKIGEVAAIGDQKKAPIAVQSQSLLGRFFVTTQEFLLAAASTIVLLYFLLASGDMFLRKLAHVMPTFSDRKRAVEVARNIQSEMARYLFTITCINAGLGVATGFAMYFLGMPTPALWGVMVAVFNFVPYLGALTSLTVLTLVAILSFDEITQALLVPVTFFSFAVVEGQFLTPIITGRSLTINPVAIFLSMLFWGWLWGIIGALMAMPILVMFKIICDHVEPLAPIGEFLSGKRAETLET